MVVPKLGKMPEHSNVVKSVVLYEIVIFNNLWLCVSTDASVPSKNW